MDDKSIAIFYIVKRCTCADSAIQEFMREYYNTNYSFSRSEIDHILREAIMDYIANAGNPAKEMRRYFNTWENVYIQNEYDVMRSFIWDTTVMDSGKYINGFKNNPFKDYKVFKESYNND